MANAPVHKTTLRLDPDMVEGLKQVCISERRSLTSLLNDGGWMLLKSRNGVDPLHRRIERLSSLNE